MSEYICIFEFGSVAAVIWIMPFKRNLFYKNCRISVAILYAFLNYLQFFRTFPTIRRFSKIYTPKISRSKCFLISANICIVCKKSARYASGERWRLARSFSHRLPNAKRKSVPSVRMAATESPWARDTRCLGASMPLYPFNAASSMAQSYFPHGPLSAKLRSICHKSQTYGLIWNE